MVNRQKLLEDIDNLLENITDEDIISWYDSKIKIDITSYLGHGSFLEIKPCFDFNQLESAQVQSFREISDVDPKLSDSGDSIYGIAA